MHQILSAIAAFVLLGVLALANQPTAAQQVQPGEASPNSDEGFTPDWTEVRALLESGEPTGPMGLPNTPAGLRAAWLLRFLNDEVEHLGGPWERTFIDGVLEQLPLPAINEWAAPRRESWGRLVPLRWLEGQNEQGEWTDTVLFVIVQGRDDGSGWRLSLAVEPEEPHLIRGWQLDPDLSGAREREYDSLDAIRADLDRTGLDYGLSVLDVTNHNPTTNGPAVPVFALNGDRLLNISTAIRWVVLAVAAERVRGSMLTWNEPVTLRSEHYSLPPGDVRSVPPGEQLPLSTLLVSMIAGSDNTATDHLMARIGHDEIDRYLSARLANPDANRPLLTTANLFRLKVGISEEPIIAYTEANSAERRAAVLNEQVVRNEVNEAMYQRWAVPQYVQSVGWFMSANELAGIMADMRRRAQFAGMEIVDSVLRTGIEAEVPDDDNWSRVIARTEGEPGIVSMYGLLEHTDGRRFVLVVILNNPVEPVNTVLLSPILDGMLAYLGTLAPEQYPPVAERGE